MNVPIDFELINENCKGCSAFKPTVKILSSRSIRPFDRAIIVNTCENISDCREVLERFGWKEGWHETCR